MGERTRTAAVFGAGIAGLTVAHELARRGWKVLVYEPNAHAGGFFRSGRADDGVPSEYSWHGMGPWYHNVYQVLREIPFDDRGSVYDRALSRPVDFGTATDDGGAEFDDSRVLDVKGIFRMTRADTLRWAWLMLKTWTANRRSTEVYARVLAADAFRPLLSQRGWRIWCATFGPWVGSDWTNVSLHQVGLFFRKHLISRPAHDHPADEEGPAWRQRSRTGWLLLRGPSNEVWFDPWVRYLGELGAEVRFGEALAELELCDGRITSARLASGEDVHADVYVVATNPFAAAEVVGRTPALASADELCKLGPLVQDGPHTQVSFRLGFAERIRWPRPRTAVVVADSEYDLTLFAQEQAWRPEIQLGEGIASLWTCTACVSTVPGRVHGLPLARCTEEQFRDEVLAQLEACEGLDGLVREANGRSWRDAPLVHFEVWREWTFSPDGIRCRQPKWVNTTNTQPWLPDQRTPVPNLALAGAHTRTYADLWSIEAAVESGRRAARLFEPDVRVVPEFVPGWIRALRALDDLCYGVGAPHVLDLALLLVPGWLGVAALAVTGVGSRRRRGDYFAAARREPSSRAHRSAMAPIPCSPCADSTAEL